MKPRVKPREAPELPAFILAPTERHPALLALVAGEAGTVSMLPEKYGCDVAWRAQDEWWGVQRKEIADFIASIQDGRLAREVAMMKHLPMRIVVIEGRIQWTTDGELLIGKRATRVTKMQFLGMQWSLQGLGVNVAFTESAYGTAEYIEGLAKWSTKARHSSIMRRPGPVAIWGTVNDEDWALHLLQSFDGLGMEKCKAILKHFGGVPMDWSVTEKEMMEVPGIGKVLARRLMQAFMRDVPVVGK